MEKKEIVERFLSDGYSLGADSLQFFMENPGKADAFLVALKEAEKTTKKPAIITLEYAQKILNPQPGGDACESVKILKDFGEIKSRKLSVGDAVSNRLKEYEETRKIISEKLDDIVSINKVQKQQKFSLIVGILEKTGEDSAVVEDATGSTTLKFDDKKEFADVVGGDVLGAACESTDDGLVAKRIIWPDLPLKRKVESSSKRILCAFISGADQYAAGFEAKSFEKFMKWAEENTGKNLHAFAFSKPEHVKDVQELLGKLPEKICWLVMSVPSFVEFGGLKILSCESDSLKAYKDMWGSDEKIMVNLLKRRILPLDAMHKCGSTGEHATFFDAVPDIFVSTGSKEPAASNYKGTSVLSIGSFSDVSVFFAIDLQTRDVNKLDLS